MQTKIIIIIILVKKLSTTQNIYVIAYQLLQRPKTCDVHIQTTKILKAVVQEIGGSEPIYKDGRRDRLR